MSWTRLPLADDRGVLVSVTKRIVRLTLLEAPLAALRCALNDRLAIDLGDGENAGWVRITVDDNGTEGEASSGRLVLSIPRSTLPDLTEARTAPLVWRAVEDAIEVRLPTIGAARPRPTLRPVADEPVRIAVPTQFTDLHDRVWSSGGDLVFLSNGTCVLNGRVVELGELETEARRALEAA